MAISGAPIYGIVIYATVAILSLLTVAAMFTLRMRMIKKLSDFNLIRLLTTAVYLCSIFFIIAAGILFTSTHLSSWSFCHGAIILCLVFYVGEKVFMYLYLVERAHQIGTRKRSKNLVFIAGNVIIFLGFGTIAGIAFWRPVAEISKVDGKCRIGLPLIVTIPLLSYDILINIAVTSVFIFFARHTIRGGRSRGIIRRALPVPCIKSAVRLRTEDQVLELFVVKSLMGCLAVIMPTLANLVVLFKLHGHEQGWLCFTICTIDLTWGCIIIHWLTDFKAKPQDLPGGVPVYIEMD
ncbi:MAG: hypothetical protein Q9187_001464 [Circinaria calcarea]